jgi:hypothetical protein
MLDSIEERVVVGNWRFGELCKAERGSRVDRDFLGTNEILLPLDRGNNNKHSFITFSSVRTFGFARLET